MEYDISQVQWSRQDVFRGVSIPSKISSELAELIGILIGDGYLHLGKKSAYTIGIVGGIEKDKEYFVYILNLLKKLFNISARVRYSGRAIRIIFGSKAVFTFLVNVVGLEYGMGKGERVLIPFELLSKKYACSLLRGLFDTDGTIFVSKKPGIEFYPSMEFATTSEKLALQVRIILVELGFRVSNVRKFVYKNPNFLDIYRIGLYGKNNVLIWYNKIGFSNPLKQARLKKIIESGNGGI